jgi:hypothetical protein
MDTQEIKFKAWIKDDGKELLMNFNEEHYRYISTAVDGNHIDGILNGWIRIACFNGIVAIQVYELNTQVIDKISKFFRIRKLTNLSFFLEIYKENSLHEQLSFSNLLTLNN